MKTLLIGGFIATLAISALPAEAAATPLARVGVGQVYRNVTDCAAASGTYTPSEAAMAAARANPAAGTPVFGENATGTICVLMHTSVPGKAEDGQRQGDHWVRVPKRYVYRAPNGGMIFYRLCNNPILQMQEERAVAMSDEPCADCGPVRPQASVSYTAEPTVSYEAPQRVAYQAAPVLFQLPGQSIGQGLFPQQVAVAASNVNYTSNQFTLPGTGGTPRFDVDTSRPQPGGDTFTPGTNPADGVAGPLPGPNSNGTGNGNTIPGPVPGPVQGGGPTIGGGLPGPNSGIGTGGTILAPVQNGFGSVAVSNGYVGGIPAPVQGVNNGFIVNNGSVFGVTTSTSTVTTSTGIVAPVQGGFTLGTTGTGTTTGADIQAPVFGVR